MKAHAPLLYQSGLVHKPDHPQGKDRPMEVESQRELGDVEGGPEKKVGAKPTAVARSNTAAITK